MLKKLYGSARHVALMLASSSEVLTLAHGHNSPHTNKAYRRHRLKGGFLILSHVHHSSYNPDRKVINLGCWRNQHHKTENQ